MVGLLSKNQLTVTIGNLKGRNVHSDEFILHLKAFIRKHGISGDLYSRREKLREEYEELYTAIEK